MEALGAWIMIYVEHLEHPLLNLLVTAGFLSIGLMLIQIGAVMAAASAATPATWAFIPFALAIVGAGGFFLGQAANSEITTAEEWTGADLPDLNDLLPEGMSPVLIDWTQAEP